MTAEYLYQGRRCCTAGTIRLRHINKQWGYYNAYSVRFLSDEGAVLGSAVVPAGKFDATAKPTGRKLAYVTSGQYAVVGQGAA